MTTALPILNIESYSTTEGDNGTQRFHFKITRSSREADTYISWKVTGISASASDFAAGTFPSGVLHMPRNYLVADLVVDIASDYVVEGNETFQVTLLSASDAAIGTGTAIGTIVNDDKVPVLRIAAVSAGKAEGSFGTTPFTFTVTRSENTGIASSVNWNVTGITATASDFAGGVLPGGTLNFVAGETSKTITVNVAGDNLVETNESFNVVLSGASNAIIGVASATSTILNDDSLPTLSIAATNADKYEGNAGATPFTFTVTRAGNLTYASTVNWYVNGGTATAADFAGNVLPSGSLSFAVGETSKVVTVNVAGEGLVELNENFNVTLSGATGATITSATAAGYIRNDDTLPTLAIAATSASKAEGNSGSTPFTFTVTRSGNTGVVSYANWNISGGTAVAADFSGGTLPNGALTFAVGETSKSITVNVAGDSLMEANETFNVSLSGVAGATLTTAAATGTILNDDTLPTLSIAATSASKAEGSSGATPFTFTVTRSGNTASVSTVAWSVIEGNATLNAADFTGPTSGVLSFAAGETSKVISLNVAGDALVEANEVFYVNLATPTGATLNAAATSAVGTILNDDTLPTLAIVATSASKTEGNSGATPFTFTVTRSGNTGIASSANWAVAAGTATAADFSGGVLPTGTVSFAVGEVSKTITVNVAGDAFVEANETFSVTLSGAAGATLGTASATGTILNDDILPTLAIAATSASKAEGSSGATPFTFTVTRSGNTASVSTVAWSVIEGNATLNAADFTGPTSGVLSFAAGETSKVISLNVAGDSVVEANEVFYVSLATPTGATLNAAASSAVGTILNDDVLPTLAIAATSASKAEGNSGSTPFTFTVTRTGNTGIASSANWAVAAGTATAADFSGGVLPTGTVSFAVGEVSKTISVNVAGDAFVEANETFSVTLSGAAGATLGTATATGTILNDDILPTLAIAATSASKAEGNSGSTPFTFTVTRSGNTASVSTVAWGIVEGTATLNAADFTGPTSGVLSFAAGETSRVINLNVAGDSVVEANEVFYVNLTRPTGATLGTATATGTILNDDTLPTLAIAATSASKAEGNSGSTPFTFTVTRSGNTASVSTVAWNVIEGTATLNAADFTGPTSGVLSFAAGETSKVISLNVAGDSVVEANEVFYVNLTTPTGATLGTASATGTILNDDILPTLNIAAVTTNKSEGNSGSTPFTFTVTRSGTTAAASTVNWAVSGGTATAADFVGGTLPGGSISFAAGETSKTITVNVAGDTLAEANETFNVVLSGASGATLGTASATATILNHDTASNRPGIDGSIATTTYITVPSSVDDSIENLVSGQKWGGAIGTGAALTYSFSTANSVFNYENSFNGAVAHAPFSALSSTQRAAAQQAMGSVSAICNVTFSEVADTATGAGDIRWTVTGSPNELTADAWYPSRSALGGDIWFSANGYTNPVAGNYDYATFIHELGHAMGLDHPHSGTPAPEPGEDQLKYSVMSYRSYDGAPLTGYTTSFYPVDYMLNDIAALQYVYGANTSYNTGNDVYSWAAGGRIYDCIWDAGGTDTIDASNQTLGVTLNLNAGSWSTIGAAFKNGSTYVRNDLGIAYGATIENAKGTSLADAIVGNEVANRIIGGGGADTLTGGNGADQFVFTIATDGGDTITDFSSAAGDKIQVVAANFGLTAGGTALLRAASGLPAAVGLAGQFLYDTASGQLWFDRDGVGTGASVQLATLSNRAALTSSDIQLVSA